MGTGIMLFKQALILLNLILRGLAAQQISCSALWGVHNAEVMCDTIGGRSGAVRVKDAGSWTHAYYEVLLKPGSPYQLSADMYAEAENECDSAAPVTWCSPSIVVCPGKYQPTFYETGGCYVGLAPKGTEKWKRFVAVFTADTSAATVYINQESTQYDSLLDNIQLQLLLESGSALCDCIVWRVVVQNRFGSWQW